MQVSTGSLGRAIAFGVLGAMTFAMAAHALGEGALFARWGEALLVGGIVLVGRLLGGRAGRSQKTLLIQTILLWALAIGVPVSLLLLSR